MTVTLYKGPTCPKCKVIAAKLDKKGIEYDTVSDVNYMLSIGIRTVPTLEVDGERYVDIKACNEWVNHVEVDE